MDKLDRVNLTTALSVPAVCLLIVSIAFPPALAIIIIPAILFGLLRWRQVRRVKRTAAEEEQARRREEILDERRARLRRPPTR